ncbi:MULTISPECIES: glycosyltransferase family 2 protein [Butyricimonas]|uniref:glycosyltransferase family 2 protein n=1 Tax=Butyricimonas TaxID=574697 RepID=UPI000C07427F|nr:MULTISPECIES: glycosyltransferase family 2 protein [Butyricimonas]MCB6973295.1 glycosyltransferase family 2 protein [Butyricimonas synergistica]MCG4520234.1 glycosyltransferase family 2 protein [Butyricimonas sp. DFI.6.44]
MLRTSLIVSTYNRPCALALCLESVRRQKQLPDEVIVGDDGSRDDTRILIESFQKDFPVPLLHIWQEDKGFRLAQCRNKCIAKAKYEYIIQIDGDIILNPYFVADHIACAEEGCYIKGGRVNIMESRTEQLCKDRTYTSLGFFSRGLTRRENSIRCLSLAKYLAPRRKTRPGLGCNMSFWKKDLIQVNGYDEYYVGWGGEDYDLSIRLQNIGRQKLALKFAAIGFHLWHEDKYMDNKEKNFNYYFDKVAEKATWCECGVSQYLKEDTQEEA